MPAIIETAYNQGATLYAHIRNNAGSIWNGSSFESYNPSNWGNYDVALTEDGSSGYYKVSMPSVGAGRYTTIIYEQAGGSPSEGDQIVGTGTIVFDGTDTESGLSSLFADRVWDETLGAGSHDTSNSAGERLAAIDGKLPSGTISDFNELVDGVNLTSDQSGVTIGTVNNLGTTAKSHVNAEVVDVMRTDVINELSSAQPPTNPTIVQALMLLYMALRNKQTQDSSEMKIFNNAGSAIAKAQTTDSGTMFTKEQMTAP